MASNSIIIDLLDDVTEPFQRSKYLNLLLVYLHLRPAAVLEDFTMTKAENFVSLLDSLSLVTADDITAEKGAITGKPITKQLNLKEWSRWDSIIVSYKHINSDNWLDGRSNVEIGRFLGYCCATEANQYLSSEDPRLIIEVIENHYDEHVMSQVCQPSALDCVISVSGDVDKYNEVMRRNNIPLYFAVRVRMDAGTSRRLLAVVNNDDKYIQDNIWQYINDLYNYYFEETKFKDEDFVMQHYQLFKFLYRLAARNELVSETDASEDEFQLAEEQLLSSDNNPKRWRQILSQHHLLLDD